MYYFQFTNVNFKIINIMATYKVRVLMDSKYKLVEHVESVKDYAEAVDRFLFYVHLALEDGLSLRCVNILKGRISVKYFQNHQ